MDISVIVPLGPFPQTEEFLRELMGTIQQQTLTPLEIVLVDDAAHLSTEVVQAVTALAPSVKYIKYIKNPWNLGEAASRNIGIASARCDWVFQAAYDDTMDTACLKVCQHEASLRSYNEMGYYYVTLKIGNTAEVQGTVGAHALFHRKLWAHLGGYPKCGALGLPDIAFIDLVMVHGGEIWPVGNHPLYTHREHAHNALKGVSGTMRHLQREASNETTKTWTKPTWTNGYGYE